MQKELTCQLCGGPGPLCDSHVIPEFVYTDLYDEKHTFHVVSTLSTPTKKFEQKGIREKLLCAKCEGQLSKYEDYAKRVIQGGVPLTVTRETGVVKVEDIDYEKFKLFQLSVIFRAGIAAHPIFARVRLGPHEERLRRMLVNGNPGRVTDYPCLIFGLAGDKKLTGAIIDQPTRLRLHGLNCYRFIFLSFIWVFFIGSHAPSRIILDHVLSPAGRLIIWIKSFMELEHLKDFANDLKAKGKL